MALGKDAPQSWTATFAARVVASCWRSIRHRPVRAGAKAKRRRSDHPVGQHRVGHLLEAGEVGAPHIVNVLAAARAAVFDA